MRGRDLLLALIGSVLASGALSAQASPLAAPAATASKAAPPSDEPKLIFDREVFEYPAGVHRDPFTPLVGKNDMGPRFEDLTIRGIIYSPSGESLVVLTDGKQSYRKHRGEMVGNARVVQITPNRVIFSVDNFGVWRQESLELKKNPEGAKG